RRNRQAIGNFFGAAIGPVAGRPRRLVGGPGLRRGGGPVASPGRLRTCRRGAPIAARPVHIRPPTVLLSRTGPRVAGSGTRHHHRPSNPGAGAGGSRSRGPAGGPRGPTHAAGR